MWNFRFLLTSDAFNASKKFIFAVHLGNDSFVGETTILGSDLFANRMTVLKLPVAKMNLNHK